MTELTAAAELSPELEAGRDALAFDEVYSRYRGPIWRLACRFAGDDALDATQEIFLKVWRALPGFRGEARLSTWIFQIAHNHLRQRHRRRLRRLDPTALDNTIAEPVDQRADPERRAIARDDLNRLRVVIETLPVGQREVLWLRDGQHLSYQEIAEVLNLPIGTVRSRLARARRSLKEAMK